MRRDSCHTQVSWPVCPWFLRASACQSAQAGRSSNKAATVTHAREPRCYRSYLRARHWRSEAVSLPHPNSRAQFRNRWPGPLPPTQHTRHPRSLSGVRCWCARNIITARCTGGFFSFWGAFGSAGYDRAEAYARMRLLAETGASSIETCNRVPLCSVNAARVHRGRPTSLRCIQ